jgi:hypothetical protein
MGDVHGEEDRNSRLNRLLPLISLVLPPIQFVLLPFPALSVRGPFGVSSAYFGERRARRLGFVAPWVAGPPLLLGFFCFPAGRGSLSYCVRAVGFSFFPSTLRVGVLVLVCEAVIFYSRKVLFCD